MSSIKHSGLADDGKHTFDELSAELTSWHQQFEAAEADARTKGDMAKLEYIEHLRQRIEGAETARAKAQAGDETDRLHFEQALQEVRTLFKRMDRVTEIGPRGPYAE